MASLRISMKIIKIPPVNMKTKPTREKNHKFPIRIYGVPYNTIIMELTLRTKKSHSFPNGIFAYFYFLK